MAAIGWPAFSQCSAPITGAAGSMGFHRLPPAFIENRGQWSGDFLYRATVGAMTVFVQKHGWTFAVVEGGERGVAVNMRFVGSLGAEAIVTGERRAGARNYLLGNDPKRWRTDVPAYEAVRLERVWPGIDVGCRIGDGSVPDDVHALGHSSSTESRSGSARFTSRRSKRESDSGASNTDSPPSGPPR